MTDAASSGGLFAEKRPRFEGFNRFYEAELVEWLRSQDDRRKRTLLYSVIAGIVGFAIGGPIFLLGIDQSNDFMMVAGGVVALIGVGVGYAISQRMRDEVKKFLMERICGFLELEYSLSASFSPLGRFRTLKLIPSYDRSNLEDEIGGSHEEVGLKLVEAVLQDRRTDSKGRTRYVTVFRGLLLQYQFPKRFNGTTIVTEDHGMIGNFFGKMAKPGERVALEDRRFEKIFEVYSTDQVEARYLLTPTFMERLVSLADMVGRKKVQFGFEGDELLIAIETKRDQFEGGSLLKKLDDPSRTQRLLDEVDLIFEIVETLNLQTKSRA